MKSKSIIIQQSKSNDCLIDAFISIYKNSIWCIQSIYDLFFKSLSHVLLFNKEDLYYYQNEKQILMSLNNSAEEKFPRKSNSQQNFKKKKFSNKTRVTVRSMSNQNLNHTSSTKQNNLGTINSHIIVVPVPSSHCQNKTIKQSENINLREQLADTLCHRSYEPLMFMNRGMCCGHCRPLIHPNVPVQHSGHYFSQQQQELSQRSAQMSDASETLSTPYSDRLVSPSIQSHRSSSLEDKSVTNDTMIYNESNEQNQSILSFPDHETPSSEPSEDDNQLQLNAQILVDDLIQDAQDKYQRILRMSIDQEIPNNTSFSSNKISNSNIYDRDASKQSESDEIYKESPSTDNKLCQELCNKLNLSDSNQISEILHIIASNAPHVLKEQPSNTNKDNENKLCNQLLLHPPFKPKRLIHLCPDGSIQVLSAVDDNHSNEINQQQQYQLNYSNSAVIPFIQQNNLLSNESPQSHSIEKKYELSGIQIQLNDRSKILSQEIDPIININLDLNDETIEINNEDDNNSLPEIVFKRIIVPENSITSNQSQINKKLRHNHSRSHTKKQTINMNR